MFVWKQLVLKLYMFFAEKVDVGLAVYVQLVAVTVLDQPVFISNINSSNLRGSTPLGWGRGV